VLIGTFTENGAFSPSLLFLPIRDTGLRQSIINSLYLGIGATIASSLIALPLAYFTARLRFAGKTLITGLLLVPLLLPPLVGAVGLRQMLGREGIINTLLMQVNLIEQPIEWLQFKAPMVILVAALHLYPLIYLNLSAAWANIDPALEEAAENQGATGWYLWRTVTLPLLLPGYLSGALIVFIFGFVDLGTPLVFQYRNVVAVKMFDASISLNSASYVLAGWMTLLSGAIFWFSRRFLDGGRIATLSRGTAVPREANARGFKLLMVYLVCGIVIVASLLPHIGVILASFASDWTGRLLPAWTLDNYVRVFTDPSVPAAQAIRVSLLCAFFSMTIDLLVGFALAYTLVRGKVWGKGFLDTVAMLPLALPGLILALGLLAAYRHTPLDPHINAIPLLILSYAVRRLPYALRAVSSGLAQMSVTLEEASLNLGATPLQTVWRVTRPLVTANLLAAGLLTFAFAVLEVSDSLILAVRSENYPIAKAIYQLSIATSGGTFLACALGVVGMVLLTITFLVANRLLGKQLGALFRV
jgi:iron(III) transport system permease protein